MRVIVAAALLLLSALPALAAGTPAPKINPGGSGCADPQDNMTMYLCATAETQAADQELADVLAKAIASIEATDTDAMPADKVKDWEASMRAAQDAWEKFRDADCDGATGYEWYGGSGAKTAVAICRRDLARARVADLKARYLDR